MPLRPLSFADGEYYHIVNRGVHKQNIFLDKRDYARFLILLIYHQSSFSLSKIARHVARYVQHQVLDVDERDVRQIYTGRFVAPAAFALMPNHFHILLRQVSEDGVSQYMQKIQNGYAKYFNTKYEHIGHVFSGPFRAVHVKDNEQLQYVSAYIHQNPRWLDEWRGREWEYPWSSYTDYCGENRWGKLLEHEPVLLQFDSGTDYRKFVQVSGAKRRGEHAIDGYEGDLIPVNL